jgi:methylmalonyl-CoA mutase
VRPARFNERLAINVQRILKEESHLDAVADPAGGAYYIEALTGALASAAWKLFQQIEAEGGFAAASASIAAMIQVSREAKEKAVTSRRRTLVGVNNYPDTNETAIDDEGALASSGWRLAASIEAVRLRTERHARKTGQRVSVLLLKRGDLKMRMARATFCQNFFGCGGFEIVESDELQPAALVVLCSSDPEYVEFAREICSVTQAPVIVAGNPKEQIDELKSIGVAGFVHVQSNLVETLTGWQDRLGVEK